MSGWIKFWKDMPNDPRVLSAAARLSARLPIGSLSQAEQIALWRNAVTGALATLWCYADEHIHDDDALPLTLQTLDTVVGIEGFFDLMPREWIDKLDDGSITLPGYCEKNSLIAKRKRTVKSNARVTRWRRTKKQDSNCVTDRHATQCNAAGDLDQDRYKDQDKKEIKNVTAAAPPTRAKPSDPEWFSQFRMIYPPRSGDQPKSAALRAANARLAEGHSVQEFLDGARRYAAFCVATGKTNTEFVQQWARFLGPSKPFLQPWDLPATKADVRLASNLSAADEFMRRTEGVQ